MKHQIGRKDADQCLHNLQYWRNLDYSLALVHSHLDIQDGKFTDYHDYIESVAKKTSTAAFRRQQQT
jgi:coproporphyrinogen III oxidase-like Fe-S oxidoreductase